MINSIKMSLLAGVLNSKLIVHVVFKQQFSAIYNVDRNPYIKNLVKKTENGQLLV